MTDAELVDAITKGDEISIGYFDESPIKVKNDSVSTEEAIEALKNFLRLTSADRFADSRHPFAYYQFMVHECGNDLLGKQSGQLKEPTQVWEYVTPLHFYFAKSDDKMHVVLEANVAWYSHGMVMSWENGNTLVRVSEFDGTTTNDNPEYVFCTYKQEFNTKRS
ncbi:MULTISPECIES: DUF6985 domain-containing protein [Rhodopirellula]|uniref:DUF6985 domain-containing protein n=1 Tax=Rhodopirellula TaxID=265488 RepID=UPI00257D3CC0|nr:hypothetical protein [Rhodopirellula sp. UBA1907]|tara:strand:- start:26359 stop:26850 length:492 start_codon:yes stop_codon:yes gene_type:complete